MKNLTLLPLLDWVMRVLVWWMMAFCSSSSLLRRHLTVQAYDNGLGLTPPMGWNSWNHFRCDIDETMIHEMAQTVVQKGLDQLGYTYINIDDCWQLFRNRSGHIQEDPDKFPSGISTLREYVHSLGLKFGLYSDAGIRTCQGRPGGLGFETLDASMYAAWKIDYLKYDNCFNVGMNVKWRYHRMHEALNQTGHPIFFSMCEWGFQQPATWASTVGNSWRTTGDIKPTWDSIMTLLDQNNNWYEYAGPGGWNDPDMLEVGNGDQLTLSEQRAHFTLWCLVKSPLLLGNDLRNMLDETFEIISNTEVIAWNQDTLGVQGHRRWASAPDEDGSAEVWAGDLAGGDVAVVLLNKSNEAQNITAHWSDIGLQSGKSVHIRDVWKHQELGKYSDKFTALVPPHDVVAIHLKVGKEKVSSSLAATESAV